MNVINILDRIEKIRSLLNGMEKEDYYNTNPAGIAEKAQAEAQLKELFEQLKYMRSDEHTKIQESRTLWFTLISVVFFVVTIILSGCWGYPKYHVWSQGKYGEAELKKAEWNRQILVKEAEAKFHSSTQLANAEIERAKGVAQANKIIGDSLKNNESYLRYLWINNIEKNKNNQVIYVPAEGGLPILEAGRLKNGEKIEKNNE